MSKSANTDVIKDEYETPPDLYNWLDSHMNFLIDACATDENKKCAARLTDALKPWHENRLIFNGRDIAFEFKRDDFKHKCSIFMNPPYSKPGPYLERAWEFSTRMKVVCLVPVNILTCKYMDFLDRAHGKGYVRRWDKRLHIYQLARRVNFYYKGVEQKGVPFSCCIMVMDRRPHV